MRIELQLFLTFLLMVVLFIACSVPRRPTPVLVPTLFPALTLSTHDPQFVSRIGERAPGAATILPAQPGLSHVNVGPPRCYHTVSPQLTCLGYVFNGAEAAIEDVTLVTSFNGANGAWAGDTAYSLEQQRIPAGGKAPYRIQLPNSRLESAALELALASASAAPYSSRALSLREDTGDYLPRERIYHFSAALTNESDQPVEGIRLIVSLENEAGVIIGYRAADIPYRLASGETLPVELSITPLESAAEIHHRVSLQPLPAE